LRRGPTNTGPTAVSMVRDTKVEIRLANAHNRFGSVRRWPPNHDRGSATARARSLNLGWLPASNILSGGMQNNRVLPNNTVGLFSTSGRNDTYAIGAASCGCLSPCFTSRANRRHYHVSINMQSASPKRDCSSRLLRGIPRSKTEPLWILSIHSCTQSCMRFCKGLQESTTQW